MGKKKEKNSGSLFWKLLFFIALGVFCFSAYQLVTIYLGYKEGVDEYNAVASEVMMQSDDAQLLIPKEQKNGADGQPLLSAEAPEPQFNPPEVDFEALQQMNKDVIGWLEVEAIPEISYPIVQGEDNNYYLHRTFKGTENYAGSIFVDAVNTSDFSDCNTIIYGHNMKNGSMFGKLKQLKENQKYKDSKYIWVCTPAGKYRYEIFSLQYADVSSETYSLFGSHDDAFGEYLNHMAAKSEVDMETESLTKEDKVITLSTCTANDQVRFVVQARWVGTY